MITKQECMVLLSDLPLYICSEIIEKVNLSDDVAVTKEKRNPIQYLHNTSDNHLMNKTLLSINFSTKSKMEIKNATKTKN